MGRGQKGTLWLNSCPKRRTRRSSKVAKSELPVKQEMRNSEEALTQQATQTSGLGPGLPLDVVKRTEVVGVRGRDSPGDNFTSFQPHNEPFRMVAWCARKPQPEPLSLIHTEAHPWELPRKCSLRHEPTVRW